MLPAGRSGAGRAGRGVGHPRSLGPDVAPPAVPTPGGTRPGYRPVRGLTDRPTARSVSAAPPQERHDALAHRLVELGDRVRRALDRDERDRDVVCAERRGELLRLPHRDELVRRVPDEERRRVRGDVVPRGRPARPPGRRRTRCTRGTAAVAAGTPPTPRRARSSGLVRSVGPLRSTTARIRSPSAYAVGLVVLDGEHRGEVAAGAAAEHPHAVGVDVVGLERRRTEHPVERPSDVVEPGGERVGRRQAVVDVERDEALGRQVLAHGPVRGRVLVAVRPAAAVHHHHRRAGSRAGGRGLAAPRRRLRQPSWRPSPSRSASGRRRARGSPSSRGAVRRQADVEPLQRVRAVRHVRRRRRCRGTAATAGR